MKVSSLNLGASNVAISNSIVLLQFRTFNCRFLRHSPDRLSQLLCFTSIPWNNNNSAIDEFVKKITSTPCTVHPARNNNNYRHKYLMEFLFCCFSFCFRLSIVGVPKTRKCVGHPIPQAQTHWLITFCAVLFYCFVIVWTKSTPKLCAWNPNCASCDAHISVEIVCSRNYGCSVEDNYCDCVQNGTATAISLTIPVFCQ